MQPGSEESEVKLNVSIQKENIAEENSNNKTVEGDKSAVNKEHIDNSPEQMSSEIQPSLKTIQEVVPVENKTVFKEKEGFFLGCVNSETKEIEDQDGNDIKLIYEVEPSSLNNGEKILEMQPKDKNKEPQEELPPIQDEMKNGINEKEELLTEIQTVNESYSVEIVESTTSEIPEIPVSVTQSNIQKDKENDDINDASFVSYDSAIMLKDVQIRLNDCLKDNSKLYDESNMEDVQSQLLKDLSFGKTLRNISGRHSIGRMRHVTLREKRISPNSSLFVNTSTMSVPQDEGGDSKVLHYGSGLLSDSFSTNGSPLDRKRKIETENWNSAKKQKTDGESNIFNTSLNLWKNLRIPSMQVSTPKAAPCNFESTKLNISGIKNDDNKNATEPTESTKKWCVIM
ncbi:putative leucine-rich repeat-containing protein DDB_G0290503 isoform X2 [Cardiocondyla obscurior]